MVHKQQFLQPHHTQIIKENQLLSIRQPPSRFQGKNYPVLLEYSCASTLNLFTNYFTPQSAASTFTLLLLHSGAPQTVGREASDLNLMTKSITIPPKMNKKGCPKD